MEAIDVKSLDFLVAIAECGSLTSAAEKLCLSQPAVSYRLAKVERALGADIFDRKGRELALTPVGERALAAAFAINKEIRDLKTDVAAISGAEQHVIRISTHCYTSYQWLPHIVKNMRAAFPHFDLRIVVDATADPLRALKNDRIDIAISTEAVETRALKSKQIFDDEIFAVLPKGHRLAGRAYITPGQLVSEKIVVYSADGSPLIDEFMLPAGQKPKDVSYVPLTEGILEMVRAGAGVTAFANWILNHQNMHNLVRVRLGKNGLRRNWNVIYRKEFEDALLKRFVSELKQTMGLRL